MDSVQYYEQLGFLCEYFFPQPCVTQKHVWRRNQDFYKILATTPDNFFRHRFHWRKWIRPDVNIISSGICYGYMSKLKMPGFSITKTQIIWPRVARQVVTTLKTSAYCKKPLPFELRIPRKLCFQVDKTHQTNHYQTITRVKEGFQFRYFCRLNQFLCELSLVF